PLIMLHGNGESHEIFDRAVDILSETYTVYAIDSRGQGQSAIPSEFHYADMATDVINFIEVLDIKKPILYGFSDGGIIGLMVAKRKGELISKLIVSGVNLSPKGLKGSALSTIKKDYKKDKNPLTELMLKEPNFLDYELEQIDVPTLITMGSDDMVKPSQGKKLNKYIKGSTLKVLQGETHGSYIIDSTKIADLILEFDK
nr:alpha/beta hydrolase [Lachnospiraceae bacterium]